MIVILIIAGIVVFIAAALAYCVAPGKITPEAAKTAEAFSGLNCAHRGLHTADQQTPENSLPAFEAARRGGYGAELDVQLSKDGLVVVFHDDDLKRVCGAEAPVKSLDREALSALKLFETGERIPLFTEALEALADAPVIVELKPAGASNGELCRKTLETLRAQGHTWCVESFDPRIVAWFRKNAPDVLRGQLSTPPRSFEGQPKATAFLLGNLLANFMSRPHFISYSADPRPLTVRLCMAMKPMAVTWTLRPDHDIARYEKESDAIIFEYYTPAPRYR